MRSGKDLRESAVNLGKSSSEGASGLRKNGNADANASKTDESTEANELRKDVNTEVTASGKDGSIDVIGFRANVSADVTASGKDGNIDVIGFRANVSADVTASGKDGSIDVIVLSPGARAGKAAAVEADRTTAPVINIFKGLLIVSPRMLYPGRDRRISKYPPDSTSSESFG